MINTKAIIKRAALVALGLSELTGLMGLTSLNAVYAQQAPSNPWIVRARAVELNWANAQKNGLGSGGNPTVRAENKAIPEFDVSYFFTENIATELVLTYPQTVNIDVNGAGSGNLKALPPSLLLQYHYTNLGAFKPYVGLGLNYTSFTSVNVASGAAGVKSNSIGPVAQVGLDYMIDKNWGVNFDLKYIEIKTDVTVSGAYNGQVALNPTAAALGVTYRF